MINRTLVVYYHRGTSWRPTIWHHTFFFGEKWKFGKVDYLNVSKRHYPKIINQYQVVVFHTTFLSLRWEREEGKKFFNHFAPLLNPQSITICLPQDEFVNTDLLDDFFSRIRVDLVLTLLPKSEWQKIYPKSFIEGISFLQVLAGYNYFEIDSHISPSYSERAIDISYRAWKAEPWIGKFGKRKIEIGEVFSEAKFNLVMDISTDNNSMLHDKQWLEFLSNSRFVLGVEGGASINDPTGALRARVRDVIKGQEFNFDEVYDQCQLHFHENSLALEVATPRIFEYAYNRCAMILMEGKYSGILRPGIDYLVLKKDFSNLQDIYCKINEHEWQRLTTNAFNHLIESGRWDYDIFRDEIVREIRNMYRITEKSENNKVASAGISFYLSLICMRLRSKFHQALWSVMRLTSVNKLLDFLISVRQKFLPK